MTRKKRFLCCVRVPSLVSVSAPVVFSRSSIYTLIMVDSDHICISDPLQHPVSLLVVCPAQSLHVAQLSQACPEPQSACQFDLPVSLSLLSLVGSLR